MDLYSVYRPIDRIALGKGSVTPFPTLHIRKWRSREFERFALQLVTLGLDLFSTLRVFVACLLLTQHEEYLRMPVRVSVEFAKMLVGWSWVSHTCYHC